MKIDRYFCSTSKRGVKHGITAPSVPYWLNLFILPQITVLLVIVLFGAVPKSSSAQDVSQSQSESRVQKKSPEQAHQQADLVLLKCLDVIVNGSAFDAKVRETVWTTGREVLGVGTYEQAGGGSGAYNLQVTMHDGGGKHHLQQVSDGRLAWTRTQISGHISLRRVDVGRLEEWVRDSFRGPISPRLTVGAWAEMLSNIRRDYQLRVHEGHLKDEPVWVVSGQLTAEKRNEVLIDSGQKTWPMLHPTRVLVALQQKKDPETGFGQLLPIRLEFWSDPTESDEVSVQPRTGRMIALIELYSIRQISPPSLARFRFENQEAEVNFIDETDRYINRCGVQLTESQLKLLRR